MVSYVRASHCQISLRLKAMKRQHVRHEEQRQKRRATEAAEAEKSDQKPKKPTSSKAYTTSAAGPIEFPIALSIWPGE